MSAVFNPDALTALQRVFDETVKDLHLVPAPREPARTKELRERVAKTIMTAAEGGERNTSQLKWQAIFQLRGDA